MRETTAWGQNLVASRRFQMLVGSDRIPNTGSPYCEVEVHATTDIVGLSDPIWDQIVFDTGSWNVTQIPTDFL
jgi:hypothetical protein